MKREMSMTIEVYLAPPIPPVQQPEGGKSSKRRIDFISGNFHELIVRLHSRALSSEQVGWSIYEKLCPIAQW